MTSQDNGVVNFAGKLSSRFISGISGQAIDIKDGSVLDGGRVLDLDTTAKDSYVKFGNAKIAGATHILTSNAGNQISFAGDVNVRSLSEVLDVGITDGIFTNENEIISGKGVISAGFVKSIVDGNSSLSLTASDVSINSKQNVGNFSIDAESVNIDSGVNGKSLSIVANSVKQSSGAHINTLGDLYIYSRDGFQQNSDVYIDQNFSIGTGGMFTQKEG